MTTKETLKFLEKLAGGPNNIANILVAIRESEHWSQAELAKVLGISRHNLSDIENERRGVSPVKAISFAKKLGMSQNYFLELAVSDQLKRSGIRIKSLAIAMPSA